MIAELDKVVDALHETHLWKPACYVWEVEDGAELILNNGEIHPTFRNQLTPLYTKEQVRDLLKQYGVCDV